MTLLCSCFVSNLGQLASSDKKLMRKPSKIKRWDILRPQQYHEEATLQGWQPTSVMEPLTIGLLKKRKETEISQNPLKENVFGLMMMSQLKMLNKMSGASAATHH